MKKLKAFIKLFAAGVIAGAQINAMGGGVYVNALY